MKIYIIILFVIISIILWKNYLYYEDYKNEPYITVFAEFGLNNKLQVILSYLYKANQENKKLRVIWITDNTCPDIFENLFNPIPNVEFIYINDNREYDYKQSHSENNSYSTEGYYKLLQPIDSIQNEIDQKKILLGNKYIACHLRRTDGWNHKFYVKDRKIDEEYMEFIDQYPNELKIYIATDCRNTQQKFIDIYGDRLIYKKIIDNNNLRQTSLQDAVVDMYVCAGATYFMRSPGTFSKTIEELRKLNIEHYENSIYKNTIVAAYYNIKSKRSSSEYYEWAKIFLTLKNPIVLYTSQDNYDKFMELRGNLPIKIIIHDFEDMYMWKTYKTKWIEHHEIDPEASIHSPELYSIWANKSVWLEDAIKNNYYNTKYFQYTDFGSFRHNKSDDIINDFPIYNHYENNKILISLLNEFTPDDFIINNNIMGNFLRTDRIDASHFGGNINACLKYREEYEKMLNIYFNNNRFAGKDESIINSLVLSQPDLFTIIKGHYWFYLQQVLSNKDFTKEIYIINNPNKIPEDFDWKYYINNNSDIAEDINSEEKANKHYNEYGKINNYKINPIIYGQNNHKTYLSIISQFKNETMILEPWIKHYLWQGVEHFYLIDNNSDDNPLNILQPYIDQGIVTLYVLPGKYKQNKHIPYVYGKERLQDKTTWVMYIDADEYFYCMDKNIKENLKNYENHKAVHSLWRDFGSSGLKIQPKDPRLAFTTRRPNLNKEGKCIIQTKYVTENDFDYHPHWFSKIENNIITLSEVFRLNHYRIMSLEYFQKVKMTRGSPTYKNQDTNFRTLEYYNKYDEGNTYTDEDLKNLLLSTNQF